MPLLIRSLLCMVAAAIILMAVARWALVRMNVPPANRSLEEISRYDKVTALGAVAGVIPSGFLAVLSFSTVTLD